MDSPVRQPDPVPCHLSPSSSGRRSSNASPEFEFLTSNTAMSPLLSADELFVNGVILPLHLLHLHPNHHPDPETKHETTESETIQASDPKELGLRPVVHDSSVSKRWKDIFKKGDKKKSERTGAELNINIWPFSRSRSAGTGAARPKPAPTRKVSSAPCSRSNSAGESKSRKWPASPGRVGVHLGRASPVWQVRRPKQGTETCRKKLSTGGVHGITGAKPRVLNLNVPMCIGYRQHVGCRSEESGTVAVATIFGGAISGGGGGGEDLTVGESTRGSNMFNFRNLFSKKVY